MSFQNIALKAQTVFRRAGLKIIEKKASDLLKHDHNGKLTNQTGLNDSDMHLSNSMLSFRYCSDQVNIHRSFEINSFETDLNLLLVPGCRFLIVLDKNKKVVAFAAIMNLSDSVIEYNKMQKLKRNKVVLPAQSIYVELICAKPKTGSATFLLLTLLGKLTIKNSILSNPCTLASKSLFYDRHQYTQLLKGWNAIAILTKEHAKQNLDVYMEMLSR